MNEETCVISGRPAYFRFIDGTGCGWYGSERYDLVRLVDVTRTLSGAFCDDVLDRLVDDREVVAFGDETGLYAPSRVGEPAAVALFGIGADRQFEALCGTRPEPTTRSTVRVGNFTQAIDPPIEKTAWMVPLADLVLPGPGAPVVDFLRLGRLWELSSAAGNAGMDRPSRLARRDGDARAAFAEALLFEGHYRDAEDLKAEIVAGWRDTAA